MQYKTKVLKSINTSLLAMLLCTSLAYGQEKLKIDGVGVVVGKNIVLDSDIAKFKLDLQNSTEGKVEITDCEMLEQLMLQKLLAHHAVVDSVVVSDAEVNAQVDNNIRYFTQEYGSADKMLAAYGFDNVIDLRKELAKIERENSLVRKEQQNITENIDVTPEEVRLYYNGLKDKGELPEFPAEIKIAQLIIHAEPTKEEHERIIKKLEKMKKEIEDGSSIRIKAIINSDDPGVEQNGGRYEVSKNTPFIKEFKEVVFGLEIDEVSEPFKSVFGYHIIQLHEIKGEKRVASHVLIQPEVPEAKLNEIKKKVEDLKKDIEAGVITFDEAVKKHSTDDDTKNNGGLIVNGYTGESTFDLTRMDPTLYARVNNLQKGQMTDVFYDETREGEKMFKFIIMLDRTETHKADLVNDYVKVQSLALQKKKQETIAKWSQDKIKDTYIKISDVHNKCTFEKNWKKNN